MAESDHYFKNLMKNKERFADLYNVMVFQGKQILKAENLEYVPNESGIVVFDGTGKKKVIQRRRDVMMKASFLLPASEEAGIPKKVSFMLVAAEGQEQVHYAMPVRSFLYDALDYAEQTTAIAVKHEKAEGKLRGAEFLSGFSKEDRVIPVISLVVYLGKTLWDGPTSLYEMIGMSGENEEIREIRQILPDYRINLVCPQKLEHLEQFRTSLQYIFGMLKYNGEKQKLYEYTKEHQEAIKKMDSDSLMAGLSFLGEQKRLMRLLGDSRVNKEGWDLCQAIDDLIADGKAEGRMEGKIAGEYIKLITLVIKKMEKGQSAQEIAADLLENPEMIETIFEAVKQYPGAGAEQLYEWIR